jgi:hypothetical protein
MQPHQLRKVQQLQLQAAVAEAAVAEAAVAEAKKDKIVFFFISVLYELRELGQRTRRVGIWILTTLVPNILK